MNVHVIEGIEKTTSGASIKLIILLANGCLSSYSFPLSTVYIDHENLLTKPVLGEDYFEQEIQIPIQNLLNFQDLDDPNTYQTEPQNLIPQELVHEPHQNVEMDVGNKPDNIVQR
jgi:hypothetical protein